MSKSWKTFGNKNGILTPIEFEDIPFVPKRSFIVQNVPIGEKRGQHAHFKTKQIITCLKGKILVGLHDGNNLEEIVLNASEYLFIDNLIWDYQIYLTGDDILWSLCSTKHEKDDYIEDFNLFLKIRGKK